MAFIKIENKSTDQEIIIFPKTYKEFGAKLVQDNIIKCTGRISATDKDGRPTPDIKVLAENIEVITDEVLENYQSTGTKLPPLQAAPKKRYQKKSRTSAESVSSSAPDNNPAPASDTPRVPINPPEDTRKKRLFCLIKDPNNAEILADIKHLCDQNPGFSEIILVLDGDKKTPLRMPFKVDAGKDLTAPLAELLGTDCVKVQ